MVRLDFHAEKDSPVVARTVQELEEHFPDAVVTAKLTGA